MGGPAQFLVRIWTRASLLPLLLFLFLITQVVTSATEAPACTRAGGLALAHRLNPDFKLYREALIEQEQDKIELQCRERGCNYISGRCVYSAEHVVVETVHVIHSNHFDAGYTASAVSVINTYFDVYFPRALAIGAALRANETARNSSFPTGLHWLTQSYLVQLYLDCPENPNLGIHCPDKEEIEAMKGGIAAGDITWHAWPNNAELALANPFMVAAGVALTHMLDDSLGVPRKTVLSQRDVPGMERSTIPILKNMGIRAFSEGMNERISPPNVPDVFVWEDNGISNATSGDSMLSFWHPRGYGVLGDYLVVPGSSHALAYVWRDDNTGPPLSAAEALSDHVKVSEDFPGATTVVASTLDDFVDAVLKEKNGAVVASLPHIQQEIGDSWIWGCASDPKKLAKFRAAQREISQICAGDKSPSACLSRSKALQRFSGLLMKAPEHTWGLHVDTFGNFTATDFQNRDFQQCRKEKADFIVAFENEWKSQRHLALDVPLDELRSAKGDDHAAEKLYNQILKEFETLDTAGPFHPEEKLHWVQQSTFSFKHLGGWATLAVDESSGAIIEFEALNKVVTNDANHPLALLRYQTLTQADYLPWRTDYLAVQCDREYGKPFNCSNCSSGLTASKLDKIWLYSSDEYDALLLQLKFDDVLVQSYGAPKAAEMLLKFPRSNESNVRKIIEVELTLLDKNPTRLGEAMFLSFNPSMKGEWFMDKLGEWVSPLEVVDGGSRGLHGVTTGVRKSGFFLESLDAGVVVWNKPDPFPSPIHVQPDLGEGSSFMLFNNIWNTNYQFWYPSDDADRNVLYRFNLAYTSDDP